MSIAARGDAVTTTGGDLCAGQTLFQGRDGAPVSMIRPGSESSARAAQGDAVTLIGGNLRVGPPLLHGREGALACIVRPRVTALPEPRRRTL